MEFSTLTMQEFRESRVMSDGAVVMEAALHKTSATKKCGLLHDQETHNLMTLFHDLYRPVLTSDISDGSVFFPALPQDPPGPSSSALPLDTSAASKGIVAGFRKGGLAELGYTRVAPRLVRRATITRSREIDLSKEEEELLAKVMSHDRKTANRYYELSTDTIKQKCWATLKRIGEATEPVVASNYRYLPDPMAPPEEDAVSEASDLSRDDEVEM